MKFSNNTLFYPDNRALEKAIEHYRSLVSETEAEQVAADTKIVIADNFIYTRGNFEQHRFSSNVFEDVRLVLEARLNESTRQENPLHWAAIHQSLANVISALAQQKRNADLYYLAITSCNQALEVFNREDTPLEWAAVKTNLGTTLQALGRQQEDAQSLKQSIDAYTDALLVYSRKQTPAEWASVMFQLGATYHTHGGLLKGNRTLQKSVVAYKNALAELDADNYALELAATHNNRGAVMHHLGESEENPDRLQESARIYETALTVIMEQQLPFHLAVLCRINKATAQIVLAELRGDHVLADQTADEFELIIECFPHALQPLSLKHCESQLAKAHEIARVPVH